MTSDNLALYFHGQSYQLIMPISKVISYLEKVFKKFQMKILKTNMMKGYFENERNKKEEHVIFTSNAAIQLWYIKEKNTVTKPNSFWQRS